MSDAPSWRPRTLAAQALGRIDQATGAIVPPLHLSTTFQRDPAYADWSGDIYGRPDNTTVREAEAVIGALEGAAATLALGSGMSAAIALFLSLGPGARIVAPTRMYWALRNWLVKDAPAHGIDADFCDTEDLAALAAAVAPSRDEARVARDAEQPDVERQRHRRRRRASRTRPARSWRSTRPPRRRSSPGRWARRRHRHAFGDEYLNGHSDVIAGAFVLRPPDALFERARDIRKAHGLILHPFEAFLLTRGLRTLELRVRAAPRTRWNSPPPLASPDCRGALSRPAASIPVMRSALRQMQGGFGGMLSIRVRGGARGGDRGGGAGRLVEARHFARRRRIADRASRLLRGPQLAVPARPPASFRRNRGRRRSLARPGRGAGSVEREDFRSAQIHGRRCSSDACEPWFSTFSGSARSRTKQASAADLALPTRLRTAIKPQGQKLRCDARHGNFPGCSYKDSIGEQAKRSGCAVNKGLVAMPLTSVLLTSAILAAQIHPTFVVDDTHAEYLASVSTYRPMAGFNHVVGPNRFVGYFMQAPGVCQVTVFKAAADDKSWRPRPSAWSSTSRRRAAANSLPVTARRWQSHARRMRTRSRSPRSVTPGFPPPLERRSRSRKS